MASGSDRTLARLSTRFLGALTAFVIVASPARAQVPFPPPAVAPAGDAVCDYTRCALGIIPRVTALDVVRGAREERIASLGFLVPGDVRGAFGDNARAVAHAGRAGRIRRVASLLTDAGLLIGLSAATRAAATSDTRRASVAVSLSGLALLAVSVPAHFAADAELSRAVWEYNRTLPR